MQWLVIGGDKRMEGFLAAAKRAGHSCLRLMQEEELALLGEHARVIALPWPRWRAGEWIAGCDIKVKTLLDALPPCDILTGGGAAKQDFPRARRVVDPSQDEEMLRFNAKLTAEGAIAAILGAQEGALLGKTCLIAGFGRIAMALCARLVAMEAFVIVCARNEKQMQLAHHMGAHPVPLGKIASAAAQADIVLNTAPARIFGSDALAQMKPGARYIELASVPYGADPEQAARLGVGMEIMGGIPGRYAPLDAGGALFDALVREIEAGEEGKG